MKLITLKVGYIATNAYILVNEKLKEAIIIDAGGSYEKIKRAEKDGDFKITACLLTHGHFDHIGAVPALQKDGVKIYIHKGDEEMLYTDKNLASNFKVKYVPCKADYVLGGGEELALAGFKIKVISTPGHSPGGVCYIISNMLFSGDALFAGSIGRTDFLGGNYKTLISSIKNNLFSLNEDYVVYPGHQESTTLYREMEENEYLAGWRDGK